MKCGELRKGATEVSTILTLPPLAFAYLDFYNGFPSFCSVRRICRCSGKLADPHSGNHELPHAPPEGYRSSYDLNSVYLQRTVHAVVYSYLASQLSSLPLPRDEQHCPGSNLREMGIRHPDSKEGNYGH